MKTMIFFNRLIWAMVILLIAAGCSKEEEEQQTPPTEQLSFDGEAVLDKLPAGLVNSGDSYAQECVSMIESAVDMSDFIGQMEVPSNAQKTAKKASGDTWMWTWNYMGEVWTFYWTYEEDSNKRYWTMEIQYGGGPRYNYIDAWEMKNGSGGQVVYNFNWTAAYGGEEDVADLYWTYDWTLNDDGDYDFSWTYDANDQEYDYYMDYDIHLNDDGSGTIDYYFYDELFYHMEWDAEGNGSWIYYAGGEQMSGTWAAG